MSKARELQLRLRVCLMMTSISWFSYLINFRKQGDSLQLHHSQRRADCSSRCFWCREDLVPLRADEHPGESIGYMGCYMDILKCDSGCVCVRESCRYMERYASRGSEHHKGGHTKDHFCSCLFCVIWLGLFIVCFCSALPIRIWTFLLCLFQTVRVHVEHVCEGFLSFSFQLPICVCSQRSQWTCMAFFLSFSLPRQCRA